MIWSVLPTGNSSKLIQIMGEIFEKLEKETDAEVGYIVLSNLRAK